MTTLQSIMTLWLVYRLSGDPELGWSR